MPDDRRDPPPPPPPAVAPARLALEVRTGPLAGRAFPIGPAPLVIGRADECDIALPDGRMSRRHARVVLEPGGAAQIEDLASHNGTYVNGAPVQRAPLARGDQIWLGATELRVVAPAAPRASVRLDDTALAAPSLVLRPLDGWEPPRGRAPGDGPAQREPDAAAAARGVALVYDAARALHALAGDVPALLERVVDCVFRAVPAGRVALVLRDPATGALVPHAVRARGERASPAPAPAELTLSRTVVDHVLGARSAVLVGATALDARFAHAGSLLAQDIQSLVCAPLIAGAAAAPLGLIQADTSQSGQPFTEADLDALATVASLAAVALENARLYDAQRQTIADLRAAQAELLATQERLVRTEQMAVVGRLASGLAHEVRNHLGPFVLADLLKAKYPDDRQVQDATELMLDASASIAALVLEVQALARGAEARLELAPADLAAVCERTLRFLACDAVVKRTRVALEVIDRPLARVDAGRVRQVLVNLLRNAADAVAANKGSVRVRVAREGAHAARIDVVDTGTGMSPEVAARVFEPFFSTKLDKGLGLGLDISRTIVEAHGGTLGFETTLGQGTTFTAIFPLDPASAPESGGVGDANGRPGKRNL